MPPPLSQLQSSGYQMEPPVTTTYTTTSDVPPQRICGQPRLAEADMLEHAYRIPTLNALSDSQPSSKKSTKADRPELRHGRSISNPFPSLFHNKEKRHGGGASSSKTPIGENKLPHEIQSSPRPASGKGLRVLDKDLTTGNCMTCSSTVRWPKELLVFRCTVCLTINDLGVTSANMIRGEGRDSILSKSLGATVDLTSSQVECLSIEKTRDIIIRCVRNHLEMRLVRSGEKDKIDKNSASSFILRPGTGLAVPLHQRHTLGVEISPTKSQKSHVQYLPIPTNITEQGPSLMDQDSTAENHFRVYSASTPHSSSSRAFGLSQTPCSSDVESQTSRPKTTCAVAQYDDVGNEVSSASGQDGFIHIFRQLEDYILASFTSKECINASFATSKPILATRTVRERTKQAKGYPTGGMHHQSSMQLSEMDAKTLLLGDFAENGSWWTGDEELRAPESRSRSYQKHIMNDVSTIELDVVNQKSPKIDWTQLREWYHMVLHAGNEWKQHLHDIVHNATDGTYECLSVKEIDEIDDQILEARSHTQRVLLKAIERLLKRPGAPLKEPSDIRFLLIILEMPLLYPSYQSMDETRHSRSTSQLRGSSSATSLLQPPHRTLRTAPPMHSYEHDRGAGKHSGIIKRILGLLSNLPNECHHHLVAWFCRFSDKHFEQIVDLVGSFVTYRLMKQQGKERGLEQDPMATLVPNFPASGPGRSAALHAALGVSGQHKRRLDKIPKPVIYNDDWQIKAAARVMALLFSANHASRVSQDRSHRHSQILATSSFYNTLLDYCDLIADFEAWEARRGKFAFCQYPFFLSIWAKIKIMEYDARRQMEVKAREAFFDSIMTRKAVNQYLVLRVRRHCLIEDSLKGVSEVVGSGSEEIKKGLRIEFKDEEGIDAGGLRKEWFLLLVRDVFNPDHGMFTYDDESHFCYFNPSSFETSDQFFLVGVVLGLAIYNSTILDVALPPFAFRKLLAAGPTAVPGAPSHAKPTMVYSLDDLAELRPVLANGLKQLLDYDGDVETTFCRDFVADVERYGQIVQVPLCPNGEYIPVTNANRREFVDLYVRYLLDTSVNRQFEPFKRGFFTVCGGNALSLFRPEEIELLIRGSDEPLDIASLQAVAVYENWGTLNPLETEPVIGWFWHTFERANPKDQRKLLSFITGSDRIPAMGAASLVIKVSCLGGDSARYPVARTCFNMLSLWRYGSAQKLENVLWRAVHESEGFGLR